MTRYADIPTLRRHISPDVKIVAGDALDYAAPSRTEARAGLENAGALGGALPVPTEHEEQAALFAWAALQEAAHPELCMLTAIPNGGYRPMATAVMLKAEGVKAGYPDILLDVPRGRWHGLRIELKRADHSNGPSEVQKLWIERLRCYGYCTAICYGAAEAIQVIQAYLSLDERGGAA